MKPEKNKYAPKYNQKNGRVTSMLMRHNCYSYLNKIDKKVVKS